MFKKIAADTTFSGYFEKTKKSPSKGMFLAVFFMVFSLRGLTANGLHSYEERPLRMEYLEKLESEEMSVRSDSSLSRKEKNQRLREIWQKQRELEVKHVSPTLNEPRKSSAIPNKQLATTSKSIKHPRVGEVATKSANSDNTISSDSLIALSKAIISIFHQRMYVISADKSFREYPISTSKYGIGDEINSYKTPTGLFRIHSKFGDGLKLGTVFKARQPTDEVVAPNTKDRDPIVTRIIWLEGLEPSNSHALERCIYIHGTPQERDLGRPSSFGCVRMASKDVAKVYEMLPEKSRVAILDELDKGTLKKLHYVEEEIRTGE